MAWSDPGSNWPPSAPDGFVRRHYPYHDIPFVETLPQPMIDLPSRARR